MSSTIPTTNISFSDIYNVYNDASATGGTPHNGSDPISMGDLISATHPPTDTMASLTSGIDRKFNVIESPSYNIATETTPPRKVLLPSNGISVNFYDDNGPGSDYSSGQNSSITFESTGTSVFIKINSFNFEHSSTRLWDRLGIQASDDLNDFGNVDANLNKLKSPILSPALYQSRVTSTSTSGPISATTNGSAYYNLNNGLGDASGGFIFGSTSSGNDEKGRNFSGLLNTWLEIKCRYVHFYFYSDSSVVESGWDMLVSSGQPTQLGDPGLVPIDWTVPSSGSGENIIQNNGSINLNQTTKGGIYTPISGFTFYDNGGANGNVGPSSVSDGTITFDAGENNKFFVTFVRFRFPHGNYGSSVQMGQLFVKSSDSLSTLSDYSSELSEGWMIDPDGLQQSPSGTSWNQPGNVLPYSTYGGQSYIGSTYTSSRYIQFTYLNNVENGTGTDYTNREGWEITLQVRNSSGLTDVTNDYSAGDVVTTQAVNIKDDFMGRTKNYDPSMQIVEYTGSTYTTAIEKNSLLDTGSLGIGLKIPTGAYDLTSSDITILDGDGTETITWSSVADGATETYFSITPPTGSRAYKLRIRVKGNTFYDSAKIWNKPADNDFCWYWNMPIITITTSVTSGGTTGTQTIPITLSCQYNFDISNALVESGLTGATIDGNITINGTSATFDIKADDPSSQTTTVTLNIPQNAVTELDSGYFYTPYNVIPTFSYTYEPDTVGPTLVISYDGTNDLGDKTITFTFSEPITSFVETNIVISPNTATISNLSGPSGSEPNIVYTALFTPPSGVLTNYSISVNNNTISDSAGNLMTSSNTLNVNITSAGIPAGTYQIGSGSSNITKAPLYGFYDYSQFGVIYTASVIQAQIGDGTGTSGGTISSLFFQYSGWSTGYTANNQTVKFSHTSANDLGSSSITPDYSHITITDTTTVKGNFTFKNPSSENWEEIGDNVTNQSAGFDTNFIWDGTSNILISWENGDGTWGSGYGWLEGSSSSGYSRFWYNDGAENQGSGGINNTSSSYNISRTPNIKLVFS
jgi:hypothetical protein